MRQAFAQAYTLFGGMWSDKSGPKALICAGLFVRAIGFAAMAWATTFPLLLIAAIAPVVQKRPCWLVADW